MNLILLIILGIISCILYIYGFFIVVIMGKDFNYVKTKTNNIFHKFKHKYFYK